MEYHKIKKILNKEIISFDAETSVSNLLSIALVSLLLFLSLVLRYVKKDISNELIGLDFVFWFTIFLLLLFAYIFFIIRILLTKNTKATNLHYARTIGYPFLFLAWFLFLINFFQSGVLIDLVNLKTGAIIEVFFLIYLITYSLSNFFPKIIFFKGNRVGKAYITNEPWLIIILSLLASLIFFCLNYSQLIYAYPHSFLFGVFIKDVLIRIKNIINN